MMRKQSQNKQKELKDFFGDIALYFKLPFLKNNSQYSLSKI